MQLLLCEITCPALVACSEAACSSVSSCSTRHLSWSCPNLPDSLDLQLQLDTVASCKTALLSVSHMTAATRSLCLPCFE